MKTLVVEDDFTSRVLLTKFLAPVGEIHVATDGDEAWEVLRSALEADDPYDLVCLDIHLPGPDGHHVLAQLRALEEEKGRYGDRAAKIMMTTSDKEKTSIVGAFKKQCDAYLTKPIDRAKLLSTLREFGFLQ